MEDVISDMPDEFGSYNFLMEINKLCKDKSVTFMDAVVYYCEKNDVEIEAAAQYIRKNVVLKAKLQQEAEDLNFLEKTARLPI